jgi:hypothetical protein
MQLITLEIRFEVLTAVNMLKVLGNLTQHSLIGTNVSEGYIAYMFRVEEYILKTWVVCSFERLKTVC